MRLILTGRLEKHLKNGYTFINSNKEGKNILGGVNNLNIKIQKQKSAGKQQEGMKGKALCR